MKNRKIKNIILMSLLGICVAIWGYSIENTYSKKEETSKIVSLQQAEYDYEPSDENSTEGVNIYKQEFNEEAEQRGEILKKQEEYNYELADENSKESIEVYKYEIID